RIVDLRLRILQRRLRLIETSARRMAVHQQLSLPFEVATRVGQLPLRSSESRFGGAQRIELVFRVELGQYLSRLDAIADIDRSVDHSPADAKGKRGVILSLDVASQHYGFAGLSSGRGHRPNGTHLGRCDLGVRLARRQDDPDSKQNQPNPERTGFSHRKSLKEARYSAGCARSQPLRSCV